MKDMTAEQDCRCGCTASESLDLKDAMALSARLAEPVPEVEDIALSKAAGRILAQPVCSAFPVPRFDNSAMDGFALSSSALEGAGPWELRVTGRVAAGFSGAPVASGDAVRIFTGAPLPKGTDTVVMQEHVVLVSDRVQINRRPVKGAHVRRQGEEVTQGAEILPIGCRMTPRAIAVAASGGVGRVTVRRRVRVALLNSGDEVQPAGEPLSDAQIPDVNGPMLAALLSRPDTDLVMHRHVPDTLDAHLETLAQASAVADLVVTTGGVSVGVEDHMRAAAALLDGRIDIPSVALKPGKPVEVGQIGAARWLGLPGNPMSAFVTVTLLGLPLLDALCGTPGAQRLHRVRVLNTVRHQPGRSEVRPAVLDATGCSVTIGGPVHSGRMTPIVLADGCVLIPADAEALSPGDMVDFLPFNQRI
ncbi:molybdopterin molybdotransferase MoeA [Rhodovulum sp. FJ3]|uniref:molybdopterin molybdotransferase MoeA n=1 Tax=Rhodovulum sp. FJ3 TaxID=3079053 RepID=UPI00293DC362|nr:molybdopterin molybdotransferase MoeA [Rhodovulum sp. FJ3]MDV4169618.1 molybdopterin molybdotransferase MoeA [Rhodovulum sp. FJ3]